MDFWSNIDKYNEYGDIIPVFTGILLWSIVLIQNCIRRTFNQYWMHSRIRLEIKDIDFAISGGSKILSQNDLIR